MNTITASNRIILVVPVYPVLSETFIQRHFQSLLAEGMDIYIYTLNKSESSLASLPKEEAARIIQPLKYGTLPHILESLLTLCKYFLGRPLQFLLSLKTTLTIQHGFRHFLTAHRLFFIKPAILHFEFGTLAREYITLPRCINSKMLVSFRGYDICFSGLNNPEFYDSVWRLSHRFHFLGKDLLERARQRGYQKDNLVFIPPALPSSILERATHHQKYMGDNPPVTEMKILSVGRLVWKKGYDYGLIALSKLKQFNIPFQYTLVGDGDYFEYLNYLIHVYQLEKHVKFLGPLSREKCIEYYKSHSLFFHPAISEGFCNAVLEAQAFGLIPLCGTGEGLSENIIPGKTGFIIDETNPEEVSNKFKWLWENRQQWPQWSNAAKVRAQSFSEVKQVQLFKTFYDTP